MGVWVDTDMSGDDVFALHLLMRDADVDGISLGFGVVPLDRVRANAAGACAAFGWDVPVFAGADRAILGGIETAERILGPTGIRTRGRALPQAEDRARPGAVAALAAWLEAREGAEVLALGPLTNLAVLALARPELLPRIARVTWMGGGVTSGNHTASAEFNALADPEALAILLARGAPIRMIDLDACRRVQIEEADVAALPSGLLRDLVGGYLDIALERGRPSMALYDPVAAAAHLRPELFRFRSVRLDAELGGLHTRGRTVVEARAPETHNAQIAEDLDAPAVKRLCLGALGAPA